MNNELHVDPRAEREGNGSKDAPYKMIEAARLAARKLKSTNDAKAFDEIRIVLHEGVHILGETLQLSAADGGTESQPITYTSAPGERATLSGGEEITGWEQGEDGAWTAEVDGAERIRSLRFGDDQAILARYPSYDSDNPRTGGWLFADWWGKPWDRGNFYTAVTGLKHTGDRLSWDVKVAQPDEYQVWIAYSRAPSLESSEDEVKVRVACDSDDDGSTAETEAFSLSQTKGGRDHRIERVGTAQLDSGDVRIDLENLTGGDFALHAVLLTNDCDWDPKVGVEMLSFWGEYRIAGLAESAKVYLLQSEAATVSKGKEVHIPVSQPPGKRDRIVARSGDIPDWSRWDLVDLHIFPAWGWVNQVIGITAFDSDTSTLWIDSEHDIRPGNRYFLAGTPEAMTDPGEFYHDPHAHRIGYIPKGKEIGSTTCVAARLRTLIEVSADHIRFENIDFRDTDYTVPDGGYSPNTAALSFSGSANCIVRNCNFSHLGGYAASLDAGSHHIEFIQNTMTSLGAGGIVLSGDDATKPTDNEILANIITDCGQIFKHVTGVLISSGSRNRVAHNRMTNMTRYAISAKSHEGSSSRENIIEYNDIENTNLETNDTGAIETLGRDKTLNGNIIRYNRIRNVVGLKTTQHGEFMSPHYTWGIYLDDFSSGTQIIGNIVEGTVLGGVNLHGGRDNTIENNILLNGSERQISFSPYFKDPTDRFMKNNVCRRNIIAGPPSEVFIFGRQAVWYRSAVSDCDYNCYFRYGGDLKAEGDGATPEGPYDSWVAAGFDTHSVIADPCIEHDENGFAYPAPESPAWKLGFEPIPVEKIGPDGYKPGE